MFVQITNEEFLKEVNKKAWFQANNVIWIIIFLYPVFSIIDFIYSPNIWLQFLIIRIITVLIILGLYTFFQNRKRDYRILLHISFLMLSITSALLCNVAGETSLTIYFLTYSAIVLFFNLQVFWEPIHSIIQALLAIMLLAIFFNVINSYSFDWMVNSGGQYFIIILFLSCLIPKARYKIIEREVRSQIFIEKSNGQLKAQNHDIAEKNHIIDMQYDRLRKLDEQKNSFINVAGHDLKNLVGSIIMSNNMVKDEAHLLSTDQREFVQYISDSADKMQYMLNKLMDVKEIESTELKLNPEIFDINAEVQTVLKGLTEPAMMKNIHLADNILKLPISVKLDKVFTGQVFQNLLSNAIKFSQTNNTIKVVTSLQRQRFVFELIDEGAAIGQSELDRMFNKLKSLNDTTGDNESKLGLGLSIAKLMTRELGGELTYKSDEKGNYFRVEFYVIN